MLWWQSVATVQQAESARDVVLGIDVGTQSCKCVVLDAAGRSARCGPAALRRPDSAPALGRARPGNVVECRGHRRARGHCSRRSFRRSRCAASVVTGQMHGVVLLDRQLGTAAPGDHLDGPPQRQSVRHRAGARSARRADQCRGEPAVAGFCRGNARLAARSRAADCSTKFAPSSSLKIIWCCV